MLLHQGLLLYYLFEEIGSAEQKPHARKQHPAANLFCAVWREGCPPPPHTHT